MPPCECHNEPARNACGERVPVHDVKMTGADRARCHRCGGDDFERVEDTSASGAVTEGFFFGTVVSSRVSLHRMRGADETDPAWQGRGVSDSRMTPCTAL